MIIYSTLVECSNSAKPDGCINQKVDQASYILNNFLLYLLIENPELLENQTFRLMKNQNY